MSWPISLPASRCAAVSARWPWRTTDAFTEGEWLLVRAVANGLEWSYGSQVQAAHRLRFLLDFAKGVELSAVRDNLRHASISTTSVYLHTDDVKQARQFGQAFAA